MQEISKSLLWSGFFFCSDNQILQNNSTQPILLQFSIPLESTLLGQKQDDGKSRVCTVPFTYPKNKRYN
jgi:hypothetical protein